MTDKPTPSLDDLIKVAQRLLETTVRAEIEQLRKVLNDDLRKRSSDVADIRARLDRLEKQMRDRDIRDRELTPDWDSVSTHDAPLTLQ